MNITENKKIGVCPTCHYSIASCTCNKKFEGNLITIEQLKHFMKLFKLNQTTLAIGLGVSRSVIQVWLTQDKELNQMNQMALCYFFETLVYEQARRDNVATPR